MTGLMIINSPLNNKYSFICGKQYKLSINNNYYYTSVLFEKTRDTTNSAKSASNLEVFDKNI